MLVVVPAAAAATLKTAVRDSHSNLPHHCLSIFFCCHLYEYSRDMNPSNVIRLLLETFPLNESNDSISTIEAKLAREIAGKLSSSTKHLLLVTHAFILICYHFSTDFADSSSFSYFFCSPIAYNGLIYRSTREKYSKTQLELSRCRVN